jgi:hypothetical protein
MKVSEYRTERSELSKSELRMAGGFAYHDMFLDIWGIFTSGFFSGRIIIPNYQGIKDGLINL